MKVLHVIGPLGLGGAQTQLLGLVRAANGVEWDAEVCATSPGELVPEFEALGVPMYELKRWGSPGLVRAAKLHGIVRRGDYDVVHANLWQSNAHARLAVVGLKHRPAVVISERNVEPTRPGVQRFVDARLSRWTDLWVGNSPAVVEFIRSVHPAPHDAVIHVANAVDRDVFHPSSSPLERRSVRRIGAAARLSGEKGLESLIDAVGVLAGRGEKIELTIAGDGAGKAALEERARHLPVTFVGYVPAGAEMAAYYRGLDVFVLPSVNREGRPNVLIEAMACGVPVVSSDIPGSRDVVGRAGALYPPGDVEALAGAVARVLADPGARDSSIEGSRAVGSFQDLAKSYRAAFATAIDSRATSER